MNRFILICILLLPVYLNAQKYTWTKLQTEAYKGKQDDIYFINENCGWYINGYGKIFHTQDGGKSWNLQLEKKGTFFRCIAFIDSLTGFAGTVGTDYFPGVTDSIPLYKTLDGGMSWSPVTYSGNYVKGLCALDIVKEPFINHGELDYKYHIYGVGRVGSPANMMVSHDGGKTFAAQSMSANCAMLFDIKMFNKKEGFACAAISNTDDLEKTHACILYTKNGGDTWRKVYESKRPYENSWKVSFPTRKVGYATIQSYNPDSNVCIQHFIKTRNGGKRWKEKILCKDYKARSFGVGFIDEKIGFIGTMNTGYYTENGGKSWTKTNMGQACNKIRIVHKPDGSVYGYAIGVNVYMLNEKK
jgi:photosystem II stability/assembly factor-like uncharacterized protein